MYEDRDKDIIDYKMTDLLIGGSPFRLREPIPAQLLNNRYAVCIGAAQTFGCYAEEPFPLLLSDALDFPFINLGKGGASAKSFYQPHILEFLNNSRFVIIQIMSARGEENFSIRPNDRGGQRTVIQKKTGQKVNSKKFYMGLFDIGDIDNIKRHVFESRENWVKNYLELLSSIQVPKILFWFSKRTPEYQEEYSSPRKLFSSYPQLVNETMLDRIKPFATEYIECISDKGIPQKLISKSGGTPQINQKTGTIQKYINKYYPSPEMHIEAAKKLQPVCENYISRLNIP